MKCDKKRTILIGENLYKNRKRRSFLQISQRKLNLGQEKPSIAER